MTYENLIRLVEVMNRLRSPGGCPWDAEQTHESLIKYQLEESYEFIEAIETENRADLLEELGDLLLQVYFHARIAEEHPENPFNIDDVAKAVGDKLIARHPHVFGDTKVESSAEVLKNWELLKNAEKGRTNFDDGVPLGQPAISLAAKLISRAEKNSLATPTPVEVVDEAAIGESLLQLISGAVKANIDPELALRKAALRYRDSVLNEQKKN
jgi:XTP/dITP diphosphohydrolase